MTNTSSVRCRHAFEYACVHANGDVVCSIIDGRGDFVLGNVHEESLNDIFIGDRAQELRRLMLSSGDSYCPAIGKRCPLKTVERITGDEPAARIRFLAIEPTTACDLRCLACPVRDFYGDVTWRDAYRDGGLAFLAWDGLRRAKQHAADGVRRAIPLLASKSLGDFGPVGAALLRGRVPRSRTGTLPIETLKRVVDEAGPAVERVDLFNFGEPFLYRHLLDALRHIRLRLPGTSIHISTDGMQIKEPLEDAIVSERLLDWLIFSIDGCDEDSYQRYRIGGRFDTAFANLVRFHRRAAGMDMRIIWQYVVFNWNDSDDHLSRAIAMAEDHGLELQFYFAYTFGRSKRRPEDLRHIVPRLRPLTALPGGRRQDGCSPE